MGQPVCWVNRIRFKGLGLKIISLLLLVIINSCDFNAKSGLMYEGVIEYSITYPDTSNARFNSKMKPEKLVVKFKNEKTLTNIEGLSGAVSLSFINNVDENSSIILVKLFNKKLFFTENYSNGNMPLVYSQMPKLKIEPTNDIVDFMNYKCVRSIGFFDSDSLEKFDILSTSEIGVENPNEKTPYAEVNGLLLAFTLKLNGLTMILKAQNISHGNVSNSDFEIPSDYERVSKETVNDIFELMQ